jgi:hypothetical protein
MSVNKIKILLPDNDEYINVPIEMKWDFLGQDDSIQEYETEMIKEIVGIANDFETTRFSHNSFLNGTTEINYEFYFYDNVLPITANTVTASNWDITYLNEGFSPSDVYYFTKPFTKSFFKLDFYDTPENKTQKIYFTIILPVQQGKFQNVQISPLLSPVDIRIPNFNLDYIGDKEGFFVYWLRERDNIDISEFYMSAKFFNGRTGLYSDMTNTPQPQITPNKFNFLTQDYFYYKLNLDYNTQTYEVSNTSANLRVGDQTTPIRWYQYINP